MYSSRRKTDLEDHMNAHNGLKPHECSVCGKTFCVIGLAVKYKRPQKVAEVTEKSYKLPCGDIL